jgi:hypothetical protein
LPEEVLVGKGRNLVLLLPTLVELIGLRIEQLIRLAMKISLPLAVLAVKFQWVQKLLERVFDSTRRNRFLKTLVQQFG